MKFTLSWLKDHLDTTASVAALSTTLTAIGLEVESVDDRSENLGAFTIARVVDAKQHPNADRLRVCQVEVSPGKPTVEVVCGAPNARTGLIGVFAPLGAFIPGTGITLDKRPVRGVVSNGMLVSERELELSEAHDGIIELPEEFGDKIGQRYVDAFGLSDPVFEVKLTPNRPDCTGVRGIARDLAAAGLGKLKPESKLSSVEGAQPSPVEIKLEFPPEAASACSMFAGRVVRGVRNGPSPAWLQTRLLAIGLRPISALVDVTNYISIDRGRPLHVYDADKLNGAVRARLGRAGESFKALDNKTYTIDDTMCVIADDGGPLGLGGIIGGERSGCTEATTDVLIECAYFDPLRTAATGRKAGVQTDARYRFERGVDPAFVRGGLDLATDMVLRLCGGTPSKACIAGEAPIARAEVVFDFARIEKLSGLAVSESDSKRILEALGFTARAKDKSTVVIAPSWRPDIHGAADIVEEVIRIVGLEKIPSTPMPRARGITRTVLTEPQRRARRARRLLAARGFVEAVTWSFLPRAQAAHFGGGADALELDNPISVELSSMRPSLLPGLLSSAQRNRNNGLTDAALFELGQAYRGDQPKDQIMVAAGVRAGSALLTGSGRHWSGTSADADVFAVKADVVALLMSLGFDIAKSQVTRDAPAWFHPGRSGTVRLGPKVILAHFGEIHPSTLRMLDCSAPVSAFELFLDAIPPEKRKSLARPALDSANLMPVRRDFAFVTDIDTPAGDVIKAATSADKTTITDVMVFDVFTGGNLGAAKKSIAVEVTLQPQDKTFNDTEIEAIASKIIAAVTKATGAEIRG